MLLDAFTSQKTHCLSFHRTRRSLLLRVGAQGRIIVNIFRLLYSEFPFNHQLGLLARVSLAFFFAAVPVVVALWDYYGFLVCRDGLYFFL
jgi:hypothetical protein